MSLFLSIKAIRLLLAVSVSLWMAGGCLFGCSSGDVMGAEIHSAHEAMAPAVSGEGCHAAQSHDCCSKPKPAKKSISRRSQPREISLLASAPGGIKDCPLALNATAVTLKNSGNTPGLERIPVALPPSIENRGEQTSISIVPSYLPNRGPTHLRCCVFLI